ncbi:hypothetical protein RRF57_007217 [Xylaria bambusicola]|uniref:Uncharacterized protein n=1 Tax=Xylaria bambusicola TaxID=326684 RepID=A0AAN7URN5_9PEZI
MAQLLLTAVNARQSLDLAFYQRPEYEEEDMQAASTLLDSVEDFYEHIPIGTDSEFLNVSPDYVFQSETLRAGIDRYVDIKLEEDPGFFDSVFESPLCTTMKESPWLQGNMNIVPLLLENGADPNDQG